MLYYPLLAPGAAAQYPIVRTRHYPLLSTESPGGYVSRGVDVASRAIEWQLKYDDLSDAEALAFETLFQRVRGRMDVFTFLDPLANLLASSEDATAAVWLRDSMLQVSASQDHSSPARTAFLLANQGQAAQSLAQQLPLPAGYKYCLSCYVKGSTGTGLSLAIGSTERFMTISGDWQRCSVTAEDLAASDQTNCRVTLQGGAQATVSGLQVEAQPQPSPYKATAAAGGIYPQTRFAMDTLDWTVNGPGRHSIKVTLRSKVAE